YYQAAASKQDQARWFGDGNRQVDIVQAQVVGEKVGATGLRVEHGKRRCTGPLQGSHIIEEVVRAKSAEWVVGSLLKKIEATAVDGQAVVARNLDKIVG